MPRDAYSPHFDTTLTPLSSVAEIDDVSLTTKGRVFIRYRDGNGRMQIVRLEKKHMIEINGQIASQNRIILDAECKPHL